MFGDERRYRRLFRLPARATSIERDLDEELRFHLDMRAEELRARGMSPDAARAEAMRQFGDLDDARAYCRDEDDRRLREERRADWLEQLRQDVRIGWRQLRRSRAFTAAAGLTLAVGVGVTTAVYSVAHAYLIRPLPYPDADRLVWVIPGPSRDPFPGAPSLRDVDWHAADSVFAATVTWDLDGFTLPGGDRPEYVGGAWVSSGYFDALGMRVAVGRNFRRDEFDAGAPPVAIISDALWARRFARDRTVIGRAIRVYSTDRPQETELATIVGVMPADVWHLTRFTDVLRPLTAPRQPYIAKLRPGVPLAEAERRLNAVVRAQLAVATPAWRMTLYSLQDEYTHRVRPVLVALLGASGFMLLIALSSVAGALLAKTAGRRGELAVRAALGASRARLLRQLLTESTVLAAIAALAGAALAWLLLEAAADSVGGYLGAPVPGGAGRITPGAGLLAAAVGASVAVAFAFALLPAVSSTRLEDGTTSLRAAGRDASGSAGAGRLRRTLIAAQIALTMVLLVGAGLMARTVIALAAEPLGFRAEGVVKGEMLLPLSVYRDSSARVVGVRRLLAGVVATPGVRSAAVASPYPFRPAGPTEVTAEGRPASDPTTPRAMSYTVSPGYFAVMEIPIVAGRGFVERDDARGLPVAIVSEELARRLWPGSSPISKRLRIGDGETDESEWRTVVGVARETREPASGQQHPDVYVPYAQQPRPYLSVLARTAGDVRRLGPELQRAVGRIDDVLALAEVEPLADIVGRTGTRPRVLAVLLTAFAVFSLGLAALALYSSLSYLVAQRTRELAVRVAVGADARAITRLVLGEGAPTIAAGVVAGLALSLALGRLLASQLYGVTATDPPTFAAITGLVAVAALAAVAGPARRATRVDPAVVLRGE